MRWDGTLNELVYSCIYNWNSRYARKSWFQKEKGSEKHVCIYSKHFVNANRIVLQSPPITVIYQFQEKYQKRHEYFICALKAYLLIDSNYLQFQNITLWNSYRIKNVFKAHCYGNSRDIVSFGRRSGTRLSIRRSNAQTIERRFRTGWKKCESLARGKRKRNGNCGAEAL